VPLLWQLVVMLLLLPLRRQQWLLR